MSKKYLIIDTNDEGFAHDYDIIISDTDQGTVYTMYRSKSYWSDNKKGEKVMEVLDNGDGVVFKPRFGKEMDYTELSELYVMLMFISKTGRLPIYEGEIIETNTISKIC
jgi:hypothetical protein